MHELHDPRPDQAPVARHAAWPVLASPIEQQLELLRQTLADNALAVWEARTAAARLSVVDLQLASELASLEREAVAQLRQARFVLRAHAEAVARLVTGLPSG